MIYSTTEINSVFETSIYVRMRAKIEFIGVKKTQASILFEVLTGCCRLKNTCGGKKIMAAFGVRFGELRLHQKC